MKEYHFKDFSIYVGNEIFEVLLENMIRSTYSKVFILVDENTEKFCLPKLSKYFFDIHKISVRSGEAAKDLASAQHVWDQLLKHQADRKSVLINLGGGVVGDLGGFCAATYKRGIECINIPTTLLSMVDSSLGGKTGIDYHGVKNAIGVIQQPHAVYVHPPLLASLPQREVLGGYAEMLKHGLIADEDYWEELIRVKALDVASLSPLIHGSIKIKMRIVKRDPHESGERKLLNFGHTIGHALESYSLMHDKNHLRHGEAIAIGMICEAFLSYQKCGLSNKELKKISQHILTHYPKYSLRNILSPELITLMRQDKKNVGDTLQFALLKRIGKGVIDISCSESEIALALNYYDEL